MRTRSAGAVFTAATMLLSGCSLADDGGRDHDPANRPGYVLPTDRDKHDRDKLHRDKLDRDHVVTGDAGGLREATLVVIKGAEVVRVRTVDLGAGLYRISTPDDSKAAPSVHVDNGTVLAGLVDTGHAGPSILTAELSRAVRWNIRLEGGAGEESVDLTGGQVDTVELSKGTNRAEVTLPPPTGTDRLTMTGGAGHLLVHLNGDAPVQVRAGSGAGTVTVDGSTHSGVSGGTVFKPASWESATDRYDIDAAAGLSTLTVDRR